MMLFLEKEIDDFILTSKQEIQKVSLTNVDNFYNRILKTFFGSKRARILWTNLQPIQGIAVCGESAWIWLDEFLFEHEVFIFFDDPENDILYKINALSPKEKFLQAVHFYTFYITNENLDFLIYFNDSNYLRCIGTAEPWLRNKAIELSKTGWRDADGFYWDENGVKKR